MAINCLSGTGVMVVESPCTLYVHCPHLYLDTLSYFIQTLTNQPCARLFWECGHPRSIGPGRSSAAGESDASLLNICNLFLHFQFIFLTISLFSYHPFTICRCQVPVRPSSPMYVSRLPIDMIFADIEFCRITMPTRPTRAREYSYSACDSMILTTATGLAMSVTPPPSPRVP